MKSCNNCSISFKPSSCEKCCSIKCKLLNNIQKENDCWIWQGSTAGQYGKTRWKGRTVSTHKASYSVFKDQVPDNLCVCHACDRPLCINPDHLWLGTHSQNRQDANIKGRLPNIKGENNHFFKYSNAQIKEMRQLSKEGFSYKRLQRIFNCSFSYIYYILKNINRKDEL